MRNSGRGGVPNCHIFNIHEQIGGFPRMFEQNSFYFEKNEVFCDFFRKTLDICGFSHYIM